MGQSITTSIVVSFSDPAGTGGTLKAEIDSRSVADGGLNPNGGTFYAGDTPVFLIFKSSDVTVSRIEPSEGSIASLGNATIDVVDESITFANSREASLSYPASSGITITAQSPGSPALTLVGQSQVTVPVNSVAAYKVSYQSTGLAYRINGAAGNLDVVVFVEGSTA